MEILSSRPGTPLHAELLVSSGASFLGIEPVPGIICMYVCMYVCMISVHSVTQLLLLPSQPFSHYPLTSHDLREVFKNPSNGNCPLRGGGGTPLFR